MSDKVTGTTPPEQEERLKGLSAQTETYEGRRLSEHAYEQRRAMLIMALVTFAMTWGGFSLSEVNVLGIKIDHVDEMRLLGFLDVVLLYTIGNFATIVKPEFQSWQSKLRELIREYETAFKDTNDRLSQMASGTRTALDQKATTFTPQAAELLARIVEAADGARNRVAKLGGDIIRDTRETYVARLRWEYQVPIAIAGIAVLLTLLRIIQIAANRA